MSTTRCGHTTPCGCSDVALTTPAPCNPVDCPEPYACSEVTDAQCVIYTGDPIICNDRTIVNTGDSLQTILQNVIELFCTPG